MMERAGANSPRVFTVTEITKDIRAILEAAFDAVWIDGEISNLRIPASQHAYFVLKDSKAQIRCVMFKGYRSGLKYQPADGDQVLVFGRATVYDARGEYQLIVENVEPRGLGALQKAFEQLKEKLAKEGLFDESRKKPIPEFPWKVGVVTSQTGAAVRDILHVIRRRNPKVSVLINPVKVQGEGSAKEIANAIRELNQLTDIDVMIVGRGGGSLEDLWAFNEEEVARAIAASRIPVISAVGHEIDFTIADFVADLRAPTPSAAAEMAVPVLRDTVRNLRSLTERAVAGVEDMIGDYKDQLRYLIERRFFREPMQILMPLSQRLDDVNQRLLRGLDHWCSLQRQSLRSLVQSLLQASPDKKLGPLRDRLVSLERLLTRQGVTLLKLKRERFEGLAKNLNALSPLQILDRGYSICTHAGKAVKTSSQVNPGDLVRVRLSEGMLDCTVDKTLNPDSRLNEH